MLTDAQWGIAKPSADGCHCCGQAQEASPPSPSASTHLHGAWTSFMVAQQLYLEMLPQLETPVSSPAS